MTLRAKKTEAADADDPHAAEDITVERRSRVPPAARPSLARMTTRMVAIDQRLLAIARGEVEPESLGPARAPSPTVPAPVEVRESFADYDPFGGLIPVDDDEIVIGDLDDDWLVDEPAPPSSAPCEPLAYGAVLRLRLSPEEIVTLPIDPRCGFLLSHIDGQRTVEEVIDVSHLSVSDTLDVLHHLLQLGAIAVV